MTFEAERIHFLGDVFAPVAVVPAWWPSDRVTNRYYMISDFSQVEISKYHFKTILVYCRLFSLLGHFIYGYYIGDVILGCKLGHICVNCLKSFT